MLTHKSKVGQLSWERLAVNRLRRKNPVAAELGVVQLFDYSAACIT
jgi:hypothetical protein